jgi:hypothetical protein
VLFRFHIFRDGSAFYFAPCFGTATFEVSEQVGPSSLQVVGERREEGVL